MKRIMEKGEEIGGERKEIWEILREGSGVRVSAFSLRARERTGSGQEALKANGNVALYKSIPEVSFLKLFRSLVNENGYEYSVSFYFYFMQKLVAAWNLFTVEAFMAFGLCSSYTRVFLQLVCLSLPLWLRRVVNGLLKLVVLDSIM